jgi:hypothetical protein
MISMSMGNYNEIYFLAINTQCFDILTEGIGVVTGVEKDTLAVIFDERRETPIFLQRRGLSKSIIKDSDSILQAGQPLRLCLIKE